ncbi:hypothetical protein [Moorena sp. SIO3I8]|uniref:hypothetical protein n=1 Tax=Moorena sp. SIO3I8 TaxID=2607833 RepID=UPI0025CE3890|nr:hypothetical protein [Moorena sp. SIO3I8]
MNKIEKDLWITKNKKNITRARKKYTPLKINVLMQSLMGETPKTALHRLITTPDGQEIVDVIVGYPGPKSDIILWRKQSKNL